MTMDSKTTVVVKSRRFRLRSVLSTRGQGDLFGDTDEGAPVEV